ncbi:pilus assembly protein PilL, partial [Pseudomonas sp. GW460-13]
ALRAVPPKSFSVVGEPSSGAAMAGSLQASAATAVAAVAAVAAPAAPAPLAAAGTPLPEGPTLASAFGAVAIRDNKQGRIEIRFE